MEDLQDLRPSGPTGANNRQRPISARAEAQRGHFASRTFTDEGPLSQETATDTGLDQRPYHQMVVHFGPDVQRDAGACHPVVE